MRAVTGSFLIPFFEESEELSMNTEIKTLDGWCEFSDRTGRGSIYDYLRKAVNGGFTVTVLLTKLLTEVRSLMALFFAISERKCNLCA